jgi:hypothetical protein
MVTPRQRRTLVRDERGISFVEGLIVFPVVLLVFAALMEFGYAVFQWNQTVKAMQLGARLAAVSDPLVDNYTNLESDLTGLPGADPVPVAAVSVACGAGTTACNSAGMARLIAGSDGTCDSNYGASLPGMCDFNPFIGANNVRLTYTRAGLGYVGRPQGPVTTVTVEARNLTFRLPLLGALLGINNLEIPAHPVTVTSEDLCSSASCS